MNTLTTIRQTATVQPGGVILLNTPGLPTGTEVEVFIMLNPALQPAPQMDDETFQKGFAQALATAGYDSAEKIVELVQAVKRELAEEKLELQH